MESIFTPKIIYIVFIIFFAYFIILTFFYLLLAIVGLIEGGKRAKENQEENYSLVYLSKVCIPITIIIPAHNEEEWIRDSVLSVVGLNYPNFELIVVDDGSTDNTINILNAVLKLKAIEMQYVKHYKDGRVIEILKSQSYPNVRVVFKEKGTKKAGAVNAGLNISKNDYVCVIDADTVLEPDSLLKIMASVEKDAERIIGIGSYFSLSNGIKIKDGKVVEKTFSYNPLIAYQNLEYIRSFIGNRIAWSRYNAMPTLAGGFAIWRRDILYELGGFSPDFTCEDIELTFRAHDYIAKNKNRNLKIIMLPFNVGWTEGPSNIRSLISQRNRWQRVTNETVWKYKYMFCNPRYNSFAFLTLPYFIFYEVLGVFFEIASIGFVVWGWLIGALNVNIFITFLALIVLSQILISLLSILAFIRCQKVFRVQYISHLVFLSFFEFILYRWIISIGKLVGTYEYLKGNKEQTRYVRAKR
ncbi:MAG: glycosyltransferase [Candidatus Omnitrophota bacterium]